MPGFTIDWTRLRGYELPLPSKTGRRSWVWEHGVEINVLDRPYEKYWICRPCHTAKKPLHTHRHPGSATTHCIDHIRVVNDQSRPIRRHGLD
ncbi:hypothetical protein BJ546DRAFT_988394 [Cryomyces antarcticus]